MVSNDPSRKNFFSEKMKFTVGTLVYASVSRSNPGETGGRDWGRPTCDVNAGGGGV